MVGHQDLSPSFLPCIYASNTPASFQLLTFAFSIFQILRTTGTIIGSKLDLRSALLFRTTIALLAYLFMSLWYTLINLAFGIPMNRFLGRGGFVVFWMLNWCTMGAGEWTRHLDHLIVVDRHPALTSIQWDYRWKVCTQFSGSNTRVISSLFVRETPKSLTVISA